jgi:hypothetical protein
MHYVIFFLIVSPVPWLSWTEGSPEFPFHVPWLACFDHLEGLAALFPSTVDTGTALQLFHSALVEVAEQCCTKILKQYTKCKSLEEKILSTTHQKTCKKLS